MLAFNRSFIRSDKLSYFVMDSDSAASDDFVFFDGEPDEHDRGKWWTGPYS